jgi:hypothetical protein
VAYLPGAFAAQPARRLGGKPHGQCHSRHSRVIGKLGNRAHYEYDESDVKKIVAALNKEIDALKVRMTDKGTKVAVDFKL